MNFDLEFVEPFLARVSESVKSGFGEMEINQVLENIGQMQIDEERTLTYEIVLDGSLAPLQVQIVLDDEDSPILYFFTIPDLASVISAQMAAFVDEYEL